MNLQILATCPCCYQLISLVQFYGEWLVEDHDSDDSECPGSGLSERPEIICHVA